MSTKLVMNSDPSTILTKFFTNFEVLELGGDPLTGANTLATMCCALAGVARHGSGILCDNGRVLPVGSSVIVTGSSSAGCVVDEVLLEIGRRQNNFIQHLRRDTQSKHQNRLLRQNCSIDGTPLPETSEVFSSELPAPYDGYSEVSRNQWLRMLGKAPTESAESIVTAPKFFVGVPDAKNMEKSLVGLHQNRALVHLPLSRLADLESCAIATGALLDGSLRAGDVGESARGHLIVTDPMSILNEAARQQGASSSLLGRFLWLGDNDSGPEVPIDALGKATNRKDSLTRRYRSVLGRTIAGRIGGDRMSPQTVEANFSNAQIRWTRFLLDLEKTVPGIAGAARSLLATVLFGLAELARCPGFPVLAFEMQEAEEFARFLVIRMVNMRGSLLYSGEATRRQNQIKRVFQKLARGPVQPRTIYQHLNLRSEDCYECLDWLRSSNLATASDAGWMQVEGAELSFAGRPILTLS
ncbi:MAG: hypothetical protein EOP88_14625, partial [Verrucomicrobiaceae bacterium]